MANRLLTADQVKEYLNISDFRSLSKEKLIEFVSAIPYMDRDVAIKIIEQFPEFSNYAQVLVSHFNSMCDSILRENNDSVRAVMAGYKNTLDTLGSLATMDKTTSEERRFFAEKMVEVADKMAAFDDQNKNFLTGMVKYISWFVGGGILIGSVILGVHIKGTTIPRMT